MFLPFSGKRMLRPQHPKMKFSILPILETFRASNKDTPIWSIQHTDWMRFLWFPHVVWLAVPLFCTRVLSYEGGSTQTASKPFPRVQDSRARTVASFDDDKRLR